MNSMPDGTVTFLFSDIEGSTRLWEDYPEAMKIALARHDELLRSVVEAHAGFVFKTVGDEICAAFQTSRDAAATALAGQLALRKENWGDVRPIRVRMAMHSGVAQLRNGDYFGPPLNR